MTMVVRDEDDILEANLRYHLARGVDFVLVTDHGSSDGTPDILREFERDGVLEVTREDGPEFDQQLWTNRMADRATGLKHADWVLHCDADEFWWPVVGSLKDVFASIPDRYGQVSVKRHDFAPLATKGDDAPFWKQMIYRPPDSFTLRGTPLEPKVAHRAVTGTCVSHGNHVLEEPELPIADELRLLEIFHFPIRSYDQFERKVTNIGLGYERLPDRPPEVGTEQLRRLELHRELRLPDHFAEALLEPAATDQLLERGALVTDTRLRRFLGPEPGDAPAPLNDFAVQTLLEDAWKRFDELEGERDEVAEELARARQHIDNLAAGMERSGAALARLRANPVVRVTEPLRTFARRLRGRD